MQLLLRNTWCGLVCAASMLCAVDVRAQAEAHLQLAPTLTGQQSVAIQQHSERPVHRGESLERLAQLIEVVGGQDEVGVEHGSSRIEVQQGQEIGCGPAQDTRRRGVHGEL